MSEDKRNVETCVQDALAYTRLARSEAVPTPRKHSEVPLILFTLLISLSVGVAAIVLLLGAFGLAVGEDPAALAQTPALMCVVMVTVAMAASVAHLAKPLRAPTSLRNLASSWLSREIVLVSLFWGCLIIWCLAAFRGPAPWFSRQTPRLWRSASFLFSRRRVPTACMPSLCGMAPNARWSCLPQLLVRA